MTDRDYMEALLQRARMIVDHMARELSRPESDDRKYAPHVAQERLMKVSHASMKLTKLYEASLT